MGTKRVRIIPDRVFHKLWDGVRFDEELKVYIDRFTSTLSPEYIDFSKYDIDYVMSCDILKSVYETANKSIVDILSECKISKAGLSHRFCIPIKTIESWCSGRGNCPGYVKLMILESYGISYLPKFVYTQSLDDKRYKIPINIDDQSLSSAEEDFDFSEIDRYLNTINDVSFDEYSDILKDTDYLRDIIHRKDKK